MRQAGLIVGSPGSLGWMGQVSPGWVLDALDDQIRSLSGRTGAQASCQDSRSKWAVRVLGLWI